MRSGSTSTLAGWPLEERLKFACLCAGLSVRHFSGSLGAPCWGEIAAWGEEPGVPAEVRLHEDMIHGFFTMVGLMDAADREARAVGAEIGRRFTSP